MSQPTKKVRALVYLRDLHLCSGCRLPFPLTLQHRIARGMGGTRDPRINLPSNLLTLCGSGTTGCHGWAESHPEIAKTIGWSVPWWSDPATVPVWTWRGWLQLCTDGDALPVTLPDPKGLIPRWTPS